MTRPEHPIFQGPVPVELEIEETPTPPDYSKYAFLEDCPETLPTVRILKRGWDSFNLPVGEGTPSNHIPGVVTSDVGFLDSPDMEAITGGIHLKGKDYVAIGRQGHILQWGFYGSPDEMTEVGKAAFINAVHYIHGFKDAPVLAFRETQPRDSLAQTLGFFDIYGEERLEGVLTRTFGENVPAVVHEGEEARREWYLANRPYIRLEGGMYDGHYVVDEDVKALGMANHDPMMLRRCVDDFEGDADSERARRLLERYTGRSYETANEWRRWLDENQEQLFFSDWYGYKFHTAADRGKARTAAAPVENPSEVVRFELSAYAGYPEAGDMRASLMVRISPEYYIYAPNASEPAITHFAVRLPEGSPFAFDAAPTIPKPKGGHISGHFTIDMELQDGDGDKLELEVDYQACTEQFCLQPVIGEKISKEIRRHGS